MINDMTVEEYFGCAKKGEKISGWLFRVVTLFSVLLLLFPCPEVESVIEPFLIIGTICGVVLSLLIQYCQNEGNHVLRASQLSAALGTPLGDAPRADYYNNAIEPSLLKLAATTFENSIFTAEVLKKMLFWTRLKCTVYVMVFLFLLVLRGSELNWLLFVAQTVFSADIVYGWLRMERFRCRSLRVGCELYQFFLQKGRADTPSEVAIVLAAFGDYECAKDEAAMPLSDEFFKEVNPEVSKKWDRIRTKLKIDENSEAST